MIPADRDRILEQAAEWVVRASEPDFDGEDRANLQAWLNSSDAHREAFTQLDGIWTEISQVPALHELVCVADNDNVEPTMSDRRAWLNQVAAALGLILMLGLVLAYTRGVFHQEEVHRVATATGQISRVDLSDGSIATLGPRTRLEIAFTSGERRVALNGGEAFFEIAKDPDRPFVVGTSRGSVRVVGTRFNVRDGQSMLEIAVAEGTVKLRGASRPGGSDKNQIEPPSAVLHKGDVAQLADAPQRASLRVLHDSGLDRFDWLAGGWREGWLAYENTPLERIVEDLNRYHAPGVKLADAKIGQLRITASFRAQDAAGFLDTLNEMFGIPVTRRANGTYILGHAEEHNI